GSVTSFLGAWVSYFLDGATGGIIVVPQHLMGFILGMWFLTQAAAFLLGGYVATFTAVPDNITDPLETLPVYTNVFGKIGLVTLGVAVVMLLMVPWLKRMIATPESH
ncbi:hypothetical protein QU973_19235, partial [Escherichia coli]|nr:hypothetical protein [Escherichia coli]